MTDMPFDFNAHQRTVPFERVGSRMKGYRTMPRLVCADGFNFSVQASEFHYCTPRESGCHEYDTVEVGFPSERVEELMMFAEDTDDPTHTVYGGVPVPVVNRIVAAHGGIKGDN